MLTTAPNMYNTISHKTGTGNMAETGKTNSQLSTSYSIPNIMYGSVGTVSRLETISGFGEIESTEIPRPFSSQTILHRSTSTWKMLVTSDSHFRPNRKWKYGRNQKNELAAIDFLCDFDII